MIFYNFNNINKYNSLKKRIRPTKSSFTLKRFGDGDGSYVLEDVDLNEGVGVLSYGVGSSMPFEEDIATKYESFIYCYDGSVDYTPKHDNIYFRKENLKDFNQFRNHFEELQNRKCHTNILKMDIEGFEWMFFKKSDIKYIRNRFNYVCLELHGLIEEIPDGWIINQETQNAKDDMNLKIKVLDKLNSCFDIIHIHGNNHSPRYFDMPDSLEITYKARRFGNTEYSNLSFPIDGLDKPNFEEREDYVLDWWVDHHGNNKNLSGQNFYE